MTMPGDLWTRERGFWLEGADFHRAHLAAGAVMVFPPPVGILEGGQILDGLEGAPRWEAVEFSRQATASLGDAVVLAYLALARRAGAEPYRALCSSTYLRGNGGWTLLAHQQTPG